MMVIVAYRKADRQRRTQDTPTFKQKRKENDARMRAERSKKVHAVQQSMLDLMPWIDCMQARANPNGPEAAASRR